MEGNSINIKDFNEDFKRLINNAENDDKIRLECKNEALIKAIKNDCKGIN